MTRTTTTRRRTHERKTAGGTSSRAQRKPSARPRTESGSPRARRARTTATKRTAKAAREPDREVVAFLEQFTVCLTSGDGRGAAACFEYPALMVMADPKYGPSQVLDDNAKVAGFFSQAPKMYEAKGITDTFPDVESVDWVAPDLALVRVRFPYIDSDGNDMGDSESSVYVVRRTEDGFSIVAAITLGVESERGRDR